MVRQTDRGALYPTMEERKQQILYWAVAEKKKVDEGTLTNSEYWKKFYRKSIEQRPDLDDFLFFASEMIKVSRIFEEGKISKEQFENKQRQLSALLAQEENRRDEKLYLIRMTIYDEDCERFFFYRDSLFLPYITSLQRQLSTAGPQFSSSHCDFFDDNILCTEQNPPF